jgi:Tfp pilus assembly protein PilE
MRNHFWKGLGVIEVAIIFLIALIVLGVIALRYPNFKCRSMQSEAKFSLQEVYAAQMYFHSKYDHYAALDRLIKDGRIKLPQKYYKLSEQNPPTKDNFSIIAKGLDKTQVAGEIWIVNELKGISIIRSACKK